MATSISSRRYNELFRTRDMICSKCNVNIQGIGDWMSGNNNRKICYNCLSPLCSDCRRDDVLDVGFCLQSCNTCNKTYCTDCVTSTRCTNCSDTKCKECGDMEACDECGNTHCEDHLNSCAGCNRTRCVDCVSYYRCDVTDCPSENCADCYDGKEGNVNCCDDCPYSYCNGCKVRHAKKYGVEDRCSVCTVDIVPLLLQQQVTLTKENEELAKDNQELREKVNSMSLS